jgi:hypothetical protein
MLKGRSFSNGVYSKLFWADVHWDVILSELGEEPEMGSRLSKEVLDNG